ncbi:peptidylprolyl isomerase [Candidatus Latescibacterota bacterium]
MDYGPTVVIIMETSMGTLEITLDNEKAPVTVKNFLSYVNDGFYDNTIFHRVIPGFMIQGGGFNANFSEKNTNPSIQNEATNGLLNKRGTIAMARTDVINSATSQFFINLKDNDFLNHQNTSARGYGYAVFGEVTSGMDVVDKIAAVETKPSSVSEAVPLETILIKSVRVKE